MFDDLEVQEVACPRPSLKCHDEHLRARYHQKLPWADGGGRKVLFLCPYCNCLWLMNGRHSSFVCMTDDQEWQVVRCLREGYHGTELPLSICRLCAVQLGGISKVEGLYTVLPDQVSVELVGYRFAWEGVHPFGAHTLCTLSRVTDRQEAVELQMMGILGSLLDIPISQTERIQEVLEWLRGVYLPVDAVAYSRTIKDLQAQIDPPGYGKGEVDMEWCGYTWRSWCSLFDEEVVISYALALPEGAWCHPKKLQLCWSKLALLFEAVL